MKLVKKISRKRYGRAVYETERILVPLPAEDREVARQLLGRDVKIHVEALSYGFAVLVTGREWPYIDRVAPWLKFETLMKEMEPCARN